MFKYSCSGTHLANWVLSQVNDQPGAIFPKKDEWFFHLKVFYPAGSEKSVLIILVVNKNECVVFFPIDETMDSQQIKATLKPQIISDLTSGFKHVAHQQILLTCEKQQDRIQELLKEIKIEIPLLILSTDKVFFSRGNFENSRLEYRFSQLDYDPDLISGFIYDNHLRTGGSIQKSLFYQHLFHRLNCLWLQGEKKVSLRSFVSSSIPCWKSFRRVDQKMVLQQITSDLQTVFRLFFENQLFIETYQKKVTSQPELVIMLPDSPKTQKTISSWSSKQKSAMDYLHEPAKPLAIDELQLSFI